MIIVALPPDEQWTADMTAIVSAFPEITHWELDNEYDLNAYVMHMAAGIAKSFWFWHFDSKEPKAFFDGCGLMTAKREAKPVMATLAALTSILPLPEYVGSFQPAPGTMGMVFRQNDKLVASAWMIRGETTSVEVDFGIGAKLYDHYGNPLPGSKACLSIAPVYATDIAENSPWLRQAAYAIASHDLQQASIGETARVVVSGTNRLDTLVIAEHFFSG